MPIVSRELDGARFRTFGFAEVATLGSSSCCASSSSSSSLSESSPYCKGSNFEPILFKRAKRTETGTASPTDADWNQLEASIFPQSQPSSATAARPRLQRAPGMVVAG